MNRRHFLATLAASAACAQVPRLFGAEQPSYVRANTDWLAKCRYGIGVHWTAQTVPRHGDRPRDHDGGRFAEGPGRDARARAYELYNGLHHRQSWDQTAVLFAVRGTRRWPGRLLGCPGKGPDAHQGGWERPLARVGRQGALAFVKKMPPEKIAAVIEELMLQPPQTKQ